MSAQTKKSAAGAGAGTGKPQQSGGKPTTPNTPQPQSPPPAAAAASPASAAAATTAGVFVPLLPPASHLLPGATLRIRTSLSAAPFDGELFVFDAAAGLLVVERLPRSGAAGTGDWEDAQADNETRDAPKKDFALLSTHQIRVELLTPAPAGKPKPLPALSQDAIHQKVQHAMHSRMEEKNSIGIGVTPEGQKLFDAIRKTTPCVWDDKSFIVMKSVRVSPPYTVDACVSIAAPAAPQSPPGQGQRRGGNNHSAAAAAAAAEAMLTRVKKIVDAERTKLKLTATQ